MIKITYTGVLKSLIICSSSSKLIWSVSLWSKGGVVDKTGWEFGWVSIDFDCGIDWILTFKKNKK